MLNKKEMKDIVSYSMATITLLFGLTLTAVGFYVPPVGEVSGSVLTVLGQTLTFTGAILGISQHYSAELKEFKDQIRKETRK